MKRKWIGGVGLAAVVIALMNIGPAAGATVPGWDGSIVFSRQTFQGEEFDDSYTSDLFLATADGAESNLTNTPQINELEPAWSPDGSQIAFSRCNDVTCQIAVMNADGSNPEEIVNNARQPAWSPDGKQLAFVRPETLQAGYDSPDQSIWIVNRDGTGGRRVTGQIKDKYISVEQTKRAGWDDEIVVGDVTPSWSPDGTWITFTRLIGYIKFPSVWAGRHAPPSYDPLGDIYIVRPNNAIDYLNLTQTDDDSEQNPSWSPDGNKIAFDGWFGEAYGINVMQKLGGQRKLLVADGSNPSWSPSGDHVAFVADYRIVSRAIDGGTPKQWSSKKTSSLGDEDPDWQPIANLVPCGLQKAQVSASASARRSTSALPRLNSGLSGATNTLYGPVQPAASKTYTSASPAIQKAAPVMAAVC